MCECGFRNAATTFGSVSVSKESGWHTIMFIDGIGYTDGVTHYWWCCSDRTWVVPGKCVIRLNSVLSLLIHCSFSPNDNYHYTK